MVTGARTMSLEARGRDRGEQSQLELPRQSGPASSSEVAGNDPPPADAGRDSLRARAPTPQQRSRGERRILESPPQREERHLEQNRESREEPPRGLGRR